MINFRNLATALTLAASLAAVSTPAHAGGFLGDLIRQSTLPGGEIPGCEVGPCEVQPQRDEAVRLLGVDPSGTAICSGPLGPGHCIDVLIWVKEHPDMPRDEREPPHEAPFCAAKGTLAYFFCEKFSARKDMLF